MARIASMRAVGFKRFSDLRLDGLPPSAKLVVLVGPNGSGKSCLFDAMAFWNRMQHQSADFDPHYHVKQDGESPPKIRNWVDMKGNITINFHPPEPKGEDLKKAIYVRSAYRHEADFSVNSVERTRDILQEFLRVPKMTTTEARVSDNYQRLVAQTLRDLHDPKQDATTAKTIRTRLYGRLRNAMRAVFDDLDLLEDGANPLADGTFLFKKGASSRFHYKNLSGGENSAFDLLLDFIVKGQDLADCVYCIDEADLHMHSSLQAKLLRQLVAEVSEHGQLWVSCHAIGMLHEAERMRSEKPTEVAFLDFSAIKPDQIVDMKPAECSRSDWRRRLDVALGEVAGLVGPKVVFFCEGRPGEEGRRAEFDVRCYQTIFAHEFPHAEFIAVGNADDVSRAQVVLGRAVLTLLPGSRMIALLDRDDRTPQDVSALREKGTRVLTQRHLESYLYAIDVLEALARKVEKPTLISALLADREIALRESSSPPRSNPVDDTKSASGAIYNACKRVLGLTQCGNNADEFAVQTLAPLLKPGMASYDLLRADLFG